MEASSVPSASALKLTNFSTGPRLLFSRVACSYACHASQSSSSLSSSTSRCPVTASDKQPFSACEEDMESSELLNEVDACSMSLFGSLSSEHKTLAALVLSLGLALGSAEAAMALGPEGPLVEEFWDNMRRYGLYFLTVFTGGLYSLLQPVLSLLRNPITAILAIAVLSGSFYLLYLLLRTMLGITSFDYSYA